METCWEAIFLVEANSLAEEASCWVANYQEEVAARTLEDCQAHAEANSEEHLLTPMAEGMTVLLEPLTPQP